jgi:hypothetical protein
MDRREHLAVSSLASVVTGKAARIGLLSGLSYGIAARLAVSFDGLVFREAVIEWVPERRLQFTIDAQAVPAAALDPHVTIGGPFFDVLTGTYELHPVSPTRTMLVLRSEHRVSTRFNICAAWWADRVMASVQQNILGVLKERAERPALAVDHLR